MEIQHQSPALHVAVGVVRNGRGEILVARRHESSHQGGLWEFPGGKVEPGETVEAALRRELREELAITVGQASPLIKIAHDYGDKQVLLDVLRVDTFSGQPRGLENQPIRWVAADGLPRLDFPPPTGPSSRRPGCPNFIPSWMVGWATTKPCLPRSNGCAKRGIPWRNGG